MRSYFAHRILSVPLGGGGNGAGEFF